MNFRKVIRKRIRRQEGGVQVAGDVNAVVSANVGGRGSSTHVSSSESAQVVQRSGRRADAEGRDETTEGSSE